MQRVERRPRTGAVRIEPIDAPERKRWLTVSNGLTMWQYSQPQNRVKKLVSPDLVALNEIEQREVEWVERLFRRLDVSPEAVNRTQRANTTVQVSPLPVVPPGDRTDPSPPSLSTKPTRQLPTTHRRCSSTRSGSSSCGNTLRRPSTAADSNRPERTAT